MKHKGLFILFGFILLAPLILAVIFSFISASFEPEPNYEQGIYAKSWPMFLRSYLPMFYFIIIPVTLGIFFTFKRKIYASLIFVPFYLFIFGGFLSKLSNYLFHITEISNRPMELIRILTNVGLFIGFLGIASIIISPIFLAISLIKYFPAINENKTKRILIIVAAVILDLMITLLLFWGSLAGLAG